MGCGACCIAASLNRPFYGMPNGKPAGVRCVHLTDDRRCAIFHDPRRPAACAGFAADKAICGDSFDEAYDRLMRIELATLPPVEK